jgi:hypothetical protein
MLLDRRVYIVKLGKMAEVLELLRAEQARMQQAYDLSGATRNYVNVIAPHNHLVVEAEWNNLAEWEAVWSAWQASPEKVVFLKKWLPLLEPGGWGELWQLVD